MFFSLLIDSLPSSTLDILFAIWKIKTSLFYFYGITFEMFEDAYLVPHQVLLEGKKNIYILVLLVVFGPVSVLVILSVKV